MTFPLNQLQSQATGTQSDWFAFWFADISRSLAQQMLLYARRELGLNLAEYRTLWMLSGCLSASVKDIAASTQLDKAQVTRAVASLTRRRLVLHVVDGSDRRLRAIKLTTSGKALVEKSLPFAIQRQKRLEGVLTSTERRMFWKALVALSNEARALLSEETHRAATKR